MKNQIRRAWLSICAVLLFSWSCLAFAQTEPIDADSAQDAKQSVASEVQSETDKATSERRQKILREAVDALAKTKEALTALEEERNDDALEALAVATGKLELIVARDPGLALAATDVSIATHDIYGTTEAIKRAIDHAEEALENGQVQEARRILDGLGSELVISVSHLPLATYPEAIKAITPLIDDGEIEQAKRSLQSALNTMVVADHVVPLPALRADALLERTEELVAIADRSDEESEELANKLAAARDQLHMAELLGYGKQMDYKSLYAQLDKIEKMTKDGYSGEGFFDKLKVTMTKLWS